MGLKRTKYILSFIYYVIILPVTAGIINPTLIDWLEEYSRTQYVFRELYIGAFLLYLFLGAGIALLFLTDKDQFQKICILFGIVTCIIILFIRFDLNVVKNTSLVIGSYIVSLLYSVKKFIRTSN